MAGDLAESLRKRFKTPLDALLSLGFSREEAMRLSYDEITDKNRGLYRGAKDQGEGAEVDPAELLSDLVEFLTDQERGAMDRMMQHPRFGDRLRRFRGARDDGPAAPQADPLRFGEQPGYGPNNSQNPGMDRRGDMRGDRQHSFAGDAAPRQTHDQWFSELTGRIGR
jgi:hypothetical protein